MIKPLGVLIGSRHGLLRGRGKVVSIYECPFSGVELHKFQSPAVYYYVFTSLLKREV